eukprot:COSAG03_NODE_3659_length_1894_cov_1.903064_1_plen_64_part_10
MLVRIMACVLLTLASPVHQAWFYSCPGEKVHMYVAFFSLGYTVKVTGSRVRSEDVGKTECILQG